MTTDGLIVDTKRIAASAEGFALNVPCCAVCKVDLTNRQRFWDTRRGGDWWAVCGDCWPGATPPQLAAFRAHPATFPGTALA